LLIICHFQDSRRSRRLLYNIRTEQVLLGLSVRFFGFWLPFHLKQVITSAIARLIVTTGNAIANPISKKVVKAKLISITVSKLFLEYKQLQTI